ncbi:MAG: hypothetical protein PHI52_09020 [Bacteroidales bacterium]|nr:hypothetical protein [Bacteroidales bacterium]
MKKFKYIIATLFVVAVGAGIFWACEKEETIANSSVTKESNKIQKRPPGITYTIDEIRVIDGKCYHVTGSYFEWTDINNIRNGECDGLIYTEIDCATAYPATTTPLEFEFHPRDDVSFTSTEQYTNPNNYTFTVISGKEGFTVEELNLFYVDALVNLYYNYMN